MKRLYGRFRRIQGLCRMEDVGIEHPAAPRRKRPGSVWRSVFERAALHIEDFYRFMPVPGHTTPNVFVNQHAGRDIGKFFGIAGMERLTTLPAPITEFSPMVTPAKRMPPPPIHALSLISMGRAQVLKKEGCLPFQSGIRRSFGRMGCEDV